MYCAAWLRADWTALAVPSSSEAAPSFAPEKYRASGEEGALASQAGGLGEELVFTAGFSPPQASASAVRARNLLRKADLGRRVLPSRCRPPAAECRSPSGSGRTGTPGAERSPS